MGTPDTTNPDRLAAGEVMMFIVCETGFIFMEGAPWPDSKLLPKRWAFGTIEGAASWLLHTYASPKDAARQVEEEDRV